MYLLTCVAATIDTHLFVYPSLSRSLLMEAGLLVCGLAVCLTQILKFPTDYADCTDNSNKNRLASAAQRSESKICSIRSIRGCKLLHLYVFAWVVYILVHGWLSPVAEWYRITYLCVTLLSIITLSHAVSAGQFTRRHIVSGLMLVAVAHVMVVFAQWLGFMDSENPLFPITGFNDNPNVTAMYLVGVMPLLFHRFTKRETNRPHGVPSLRWRVLGGAFIILAILLLRCRTAYIGLAVEICVFLLIKFLFSPTERKVEKLKSGKIEVSSNKELPLLNSSTFKFYKVCIVCGTIIIAAISVGKLYNMKRDSADGRLLIWRLSAQMIAEQPLGHGYGLFEKHYNLRQAEYFRNNGGTDTERRNAAFTCMAYNDYLEHGVDGGIIGMAFLIGFYALAIRRAYKQRDTAATAILTAFAVMSLVNFVTAGIQTWLLVICAVSMIQKPFPPPSPIGREPLRKEPLSFFTVPLLKNTLHKFRPDGAPSLWGRAVGEALALFFTVSMVMSQITLKKLNDRLKDGDPIPDMEFAALQPHIRTSEAYWRIRARNKMRMQDYRDAVPCVERAMQYSASPNLCYMAHQCHTALGSEKSGMLYIYNVYDTQPSLLLPKLILMRYHDCRGDTDAATAYAHEITVTATRNDTKITEAIKNEAYNYINNLNNKQLQ